MRLGLPFLHELLPHAHRERQIGQTIAVQVPELAPAAAELAAAETMRFDGHLGPARDLAFDSRGDALRHRRIIEPRQRLSYGALMKVGTRSGRITSCVDINVIV
jgi:hypothetical protein